MKEHRLKCWPEYFQQVWEGRKTFEVRKDDRHYQEGDTVILQEWDVVSQYSGRELKFTIGYVFRGGTLGGLQEGYCVFSLLTM